MQAMVPPIPRKNVMRIIAQPHTEPISPYARQNVPGNRSVYENPDVPEDIIVVEAGGGGGGGVSLTFPRWP